MGKVKENVGRTVGDVGKCVGMWEGGVEKYWGRCGKVCWGVRKVRVDVGRGVEKCVRLWGKV